MNFKLLLHKKVLIIYYHSNKTENGCLWVAVQDRDAGFTRISYHPACHLSSWLPSGKDGCHNVGLHSPVPDSWKKERYLIPLESVPFKKFLEDPPRNAPSH